MSQSIISEGKTTNEAIENGLKKLLRQKMNIVVPLLLTESM